MNKRVVGMFLSIIFISVGCWRATVPISGRMESLNCCKPDRGECEVNYTSSSVSDGLLLTEVEILNGTFKNPFQLSGFDEYRWCVTFIPTPYLCPHAPETFLIIWTALLITLGMIWSFVIISNTDGHDVCTIRNTKPIDMIREDMGYEFFLIMVPFLVLIFVIVYEIINKKFGKKKVEQYQILSSV